MHTARLFVLFLMICCSNRSELTEEWIKGVNNGSHIINDYNGFRFDIQQVIGQQDLEVVSHKSYRKYLLKIGRTDGTDFMSGFGAAQKDCLYYFSFLFQEDIFLKIKNEKVPCAFVHFENALNSKNESIFHLVFDVSTLEFEPDDKLTIIINSERLSNLPIQFNLKSTLPKNFNL